MQISVPAAKNSYSESFTDGLDPGEQSFGHTVEIVTLRIPAIGVDDRTDRIACWSCAHGRNR